MSVQKGERGRMMQDAMWRRPTPRAWAVGLWLVMLVAPAPTAVAEPWHQLQRTSRHMGTQFKITVYAQDLAAAQRGLDAAFAKIGKLDEMMSDYRPDSEIRRLPRDAPHESAVAVSLDTWRVLTEAQQIAHLSDGAFDVTVGPLTRVWRKARRTRTWPPQDQIDAARNAVGHSFLQVDAHAPRVRCLKHGMAIDLGGIAKGYALDASYQVLVDHGLRRALIDGGGDVIAGDPPPDQTSWRIQLAGLTTDQANATIVHLHNQAIASSGDLWQFIRHHGQRYSHIIDPRTGLGVEGPSSATVIAPSATRADAWASALSVLGASRGIARIGQQPSLEARVTFIRHGDVEYHETPGFLEFLQQRQTQ